MADSTRDDILALLARHPPGLAVSKVAEAMGIAPPTAHRHLQRLVREGQVARTGPRGAPLYAARPFVGIRWTDPGRRLHLSWEAHGEISWRYPLVSRVPDAPARRILLGLLRQADERNLFLPAPMEGRLSGGEVLDVALVKPSGPSGSGMTWVVYGSCARGEARPKSDLDLLIVEEPGLSRREALMDLADGAALWAERAVDLHVVSRDAMETLPRGLQTAILQDGITVFVTDDNAEFIESRRSS